MSQRHGWDIRTRMLAISLGPALLLTLLLTAYFTGVPSHAALYALSLFGMPTGFALLLLYVILAAVLRSRL